MEDERKAFSAIDTAWKASSQHTDPKKAKDVNQISQRLGFGFQQAKYTGEFSDANLRDGKGKLNWQNGDFYEGSFKDGLRQFVFCNQVCTNSPLMIIISHTVDRDAMCVMEENIFMRGVGGQEKNMATERKSGT